VAGELLGSSHSSRRHCGGTQWRITWSPGAADSSALTSATRDLSTGHVENLPEGVELTLGDVADGELVKRLMHGVDGCFHLAAVASVVRSVEAWSETHRINLGGTINVLDAARDANPNRPARVVYASSAAIYGDNASIMACRRRASAFSMSTVRARTRLRLIRE
jgi:nucleoside-diphosphate-sugar epimerase